MATEDSCTEDDDTLVKQYYEDGVIGPINVLTREEADGIFQACDLWTQSLLSASSTLRSTTSSSDNNDTTATPAMSIATTTMLGNLRFKPHLFLPWVNRLVRHPTLVAVVQQVLRSSDIWCWSSDFNIKMPSSPYYVSPHQDSTYAGLYPADQVVTAWIAITDPVTKQHGGLVFWKGSHLLGQLPHTDNPDDHYNLLSRRQSCVTGQSTEESSFIEISLCAGQATLHHFYTVHESGPNQSLQPRIGLAIRYMTNAVRQMGHVRECATWISGNRHNDGFDSEPILSESPTELEIQNGYDAHADAMERETRNYFASFKDVVTRTRYDGPNQNNNATIPVDS